ncbi:MAG TPA: RNA ligase family protein [Gemmataceae bacterium]|nr:RNA ligase family protein [Gemmataceae bacterium]
MNIHKYPRTFHLQGSRLQPGDEDLEAVPWSDVIGRYVVVEEKMDGANSGMSFDPAGKMYLQSRGHFLTGGRREKHFNLFKKWASEVAPDLWPRLGDRYVMYGEWLYAKHTIFYDRLPNYFLEFDVLDTETESFLSTPRRRELLAELRVESVDVLWEGVLSDPEPVIALVGPSRFKSADWRERLKAQAAARGLDPERVRRETDPSDDMEGLYIKVEEEGEVKARYKYVRADFLSAVLDSGTHWLRRPIVPNVVISGPSLD